MKFKAIATKDDSEFQNWLSQVKKSKMKMQSMDDFEKLAQPSEKHPVQYFSEADPRMLERVIHQFMEKNHQTRDESMQLDHETFAKAKE
jgi:cytochrome o ubiquinol oxidase subunit 2